MVWRCGNPLHLWHRIIAFFYLKKDKALEQMYSHFPSWLLVVLLSELLYAWHISLSKTVKKCIQISSRYQETEYENSRFFPCKHLLICVLLILQETTWRSQLVRGLRRRGLGPWGRLVQPRAPSGGPAKLTHQDGCRLRRNLRQVPPMSFQLRILCKFLEYWT